MSNRQRSLGLPPTNVLSSYEILYALVACLRCFVSSVAFELGSEKFASCDQNVSLFDICYECPVGRRYCSRFNFVLPWRNRFASGSDLRRSVCFLIGGNRIEFIQSETFIDSCHPGPDQSLSMHF